MTTLTVTFVFRPTLEYIENIIKEEERVQRRKKTPVCFKMSKQKQVNSACYIVNDKYRAHVCL